jgi:hypothetical protein
MICSSKISFINQPVDQAPSQYSPMMLSVLPSIFALFFGHLLRGSHAANIQVAPWVPPGLGAQLHYAFEDAISLATLAAVSLNPTSDTYFRYVDAQTLASCGGCLCALAIFPSIRILPPRAGSRFSMTSGGEGCTQSYQVYPYKLGMLKVKVHKSARRERMPMSSKSSLEADNSPLIYVYPRTFEQFLYAARMRDGYERLGFAALST